MLKGKIALVTGASRGIGKQTAITLAQNGATVIVNYNGSKEKALEVVQEIENNGGTAISYCCNVSDYDAVEEMMKFIVKEFDGLDILVNNAGITKDGLLMRMSEDDYDKVLDINLKGTFNCIRHISRQMVKQRSGRIINLSSVVGLYGNGGQVNYSASKAGVIGITKSVAKELGSRGITVNAIAPGFIITDMTDAVSDEVKNHVVDKIALKRLGKTEDVANLVIFLASDAASYITGQVICLDGGMSL